MSPRRFRHRMVLQEAARTADGLGGFAVAWNDVATVWAALGLEASASAPERTEAGQPKPRQALRIELRRRDGLALGQRLRWGSRAYLIQGIEEDGEGYAVTLLTEEVAV